MNVCSVALLAIGIWACSGQKKGTANVEVATDSVEVTADAKSVQADSTGYIRRDGSGFHNYLDRWEASEFIFPSW